MIDKSIEVSQRNAIDGNRSKDVTHDMRAEQLVSPSWKTFMLLGTFLFSKQTRPYDYADA
jgi:hypothetical protein